MTDAILILKLILIVIQTIAVITIAVWFFKGEDIYQYDAVPWILAIFLGPLNMLIR